MNLTKEELRIILALLEHEMHQLGLTKQESDLMLKLDNWYNNPNV